MGEIRNGSRSFLNLLAKACKMSRMRGFNVGLTAILGPSNAAALSDVWEPLCGFVEGLIGFDNWFNQIDYSQETEDSEDIAV